MVKLSSSLLDDSSSVPGSYNCSLTNNYHRLSTRLADVPRIYTRPVQDVYETTYKHVGLDDFIFPSHPREKRSASVLYLEARYIPQQGICVWRLNGGLAQKRAAGNCLFLTHIFGMRMIPADVSRYLIGGRL